MTIQHLISLRITRTLAALVCAGLCLVVLAYQAQSSHLQSGGLIEQQGTLLSFEASAQGGGGAFKITQAHPYL